MIKEAGIYDLSADEYHADPTPAPSLSASIAKELIARSAHHAFWAHPKLNPAYEPEHEERFDLGSATHAYMLEGDEAFSLVEAPDWRGKLAREARDDARSRGKIPLLVSQWGEIQAMVRAANDQLDRHEDPPRPFSNGRAEETLVWQESNGIWCRARLDWLAEDHRHIFDLKTTAASANPDAWSRTMFSMGFDLQAAWYLRGLRAVMGIDGVFKFVVLETSAPYGLSVIDLSPAALVLAEKKCLSAIEQWGHCLQAGVFPGYPTRTVTAELPPWIEAAWLEKEMRDDGRPVSAQLLGDA